MFQSSSIYIYYIHISDDEAFFQIFLKFWGIRSINRPMIHMTDWISKHTLLRHPSQKKNEELNNLKHFKIWLFILWAFFLEAWSNSICLYVIISLLQLKTFLMMPRKTLWLMSNHFNYDRFWLDVIYTQFYNKLP